MRHLICAWVLGSVLWASCGAVAAEPATLIEEAIANITTLARPGRVGYATIWDGNKYVQCRRLPDHNMRCEAAGAAMQPSLNGVLDPPHLQALADLGWSLDQSFGNYVRVFPAAMSNRNVAGHVFDLLSRAYDAVPAELEVATNWIADLPCPPRNGPSQNLAGSVNDAPAMRLYSIRTCSFQPQAPVNASDAQKDLLTQYGPLVTAELQRLRINARRKVYTVFDAGIGYVQCTPKSSARVLFCEAQSAESWPALAVVLTPERVAKLQAAGFSPPGRSPNHWRDYSLDERTDAELAAEIISVLRDVYGYSGNVKLVIRTEQS